MRGPLRPATTRAGPRPVGHPLTPDAAAVTPLIGTVLILGIAVAGLAVVMTWGLPAMQQAQADAELAGMLHQFENLEELAENVVRSGGVGKANEATLSFTQGQVQRSDGMFFILTMHPHEPPFEERYWIEVAKDREKHDITVHAGVDVPDTNGRWADVWAVTSDGESSRDSKSFNGAGQVSFGTIAHDIDQGSLRVRVWVDAGDEDVILMEGWLLPSGALEYDRQTPFGEVSMHLEFGSVITTYESGSHIHTEPLARLEYESGNPAFLGFFAQLFVPNSEQGGLESAGPGGHPIRLSLQENILRIGGANVEEVGIQAIGPRSMIWEELYEERYDFVPAADAHPLDPQARGVVLQAGDDGEGNVAPFQFVLMENRIELSLLPGVQRLDV